MTRLLRWLDHLPSWLRSGVVTGTVTAFVTSGAALLAWLEDFFEWAAGAPGVTFPDIGVLRALVVGIAAGGVFGAANATFRGAQEWLRRHGWSVGNPPAYPDKAGR